MGRMQEHEALKEGKEDRKVKHRERTERFEVRDGLHLLLLAFKMEKGGYAGTFRSWEQSQASSQLENRDLSPYLQPRESDFCQQPEQIWKWISPQSLQKGTQPWHLDFSLWNLENKTS